MKNTKGDDALRKKYPTAAKWKQEGLEQFPKLPLFFKLRNIASHGLDKKGLREAVRKRFQSPIFLGYTNKELKEMENFCVENGNILMALIRLAKAVDKTQRDTLKERMKQITKMEVEGSRKEAAKNLANALLPKTRGGPGCYFQDEELVLKCLYLELRDCIKLMRRHLDIPCKKTSGCSHNTIEDAKKELPDISDILTDEEIPDLIKQDYSPSKAALKIISHRLKRSKNLSRRLTPRAIQNIVYKLPRELTPDLNTQFR